MTDPNEPTEETVQISSDAWNALQDEATRTSRAPQDVLTDALQEHLETGRSLPKSLDNLRKKT